MSDLEFLSWQQYTKESLEFLKISESLQDTWSWEIKGSSEGQAFLKYAQKIRDPSSNDLLHLEYHVVYSVTYQVPVLYLQAHHDDGKIISLEKAWDIFQAARGDETQYTRQRMLNILTQMEHPVLFKPCLCLHPCRTAELLAKTKSSNRIITFISLMGPYVQLKLPPAYCLVIEK
ncbi:autophagy-related 10 [Glossina fuscipes fuscipes]